MKTSIIKYSVVLLMFFVIVSCKEDYAELIQKIEFAQRELLQKDSALIIQRNELFAIVYRGSNKKPNINQEDSVLSNLINKQSTLITRLEILSQKNKVLIDKLNESAENPEEIYNEYKSHADELELMNPEISAAKTDYEKIVGEVDQAFKSPKDTTKTK